MSFEGFIEQSTTITISLGPFIDKDDGDTEKTGLTIEDTDVYLSKNGGAKGNPNDTNDCTEDADGVYRKQLNSTDTGTLGRLAIYCHFTDCLYIRQNYIVLDPESYAGFVTGTAFGTDDKILVSTDAQDLSATLDVNIKTVTAGIIANASFNSDVGSTAYASNIIALAVRKVLDELNLDHLMKTAVGSNADMTTEVTDGSVLSNIMTKGSDTSDFTVANDSLEGNRDKPNIEAIPVIPSVVDLAGGQVALSLMLRDSSQSTRITTAQITDPGKITIQQKALGGSVWSSIVNAGSMGEVDGMVVYNEVFDSGAGYVAGALLRIFIYDIEVTIDGVAYDISPAGAGVSFISQIRQVVRGTDNAALAAVCTEARLAELDAANLPADLDAVLEDTNELQGLISASKLPVQVKGIDADVVTLDSVADTLLQSLSRLGHTNISITKASAAVTAQNITAAMVSAGVIQYETIKISKTRDFASPDTTIYRLWKYDAMGDVFEVKPSTGTTW